MVKNFLNFFSNSIRSSVWRSVCLQSFLIHFDCSLPFETYLLQKYFGIHHSSNLFRLLSTFLLNLNQYILIISLNGMKTVKHRARPEGLIYSIEWLRHRLILIAFECHPLHLFSMILFDSIFKHHLDVRKFSRSRSIFFDSDFIISKQWFHSISSELDNFIQ